MSRFANKIYVDRLKAAPCTDCEQCFPPEAMDFDHVKGEKIANISEMLTGPREKLDAELAKTELVCAICHRVREQRRRLDALVDVAEAMDVDDYLASSLIGVVP